MKKKFLASAVGVILLAATNVVCAQNDLPSTSVQSKTCSMQGPHTRAGLIGQFHGILTKEQMTALHKYKIQQKSRFQSINIKRQHDQEALYHLITTKGASKSALDKAIDDVTGDEKQLKNIKYDIVIHAYQIATDDQKPGVAEILQRLILPTHSCSLPKKQ